MLAVVQARVPPYSLFPPFIPFVGVNLRSQSRSQPSPLSLLLQWNCNEARITHNLLYIIMHIIPELEFLTFSINLFYISNFTRKRFALGGPSEPPRNSLGSGTLTLSVLSVHRERTQLKIFHQYKLNSSELGDKVKTSDGMEFQRKTILSGGCTAV